MGFRSWTKIELSAVPDQKGKTMKTITGIFKKQDMHTVTIDGRMYARTSQSVIPQGLKEGDKVQVTYTVDGITGVPGAEIRTIVEIKKVPNP